MIFAFLSRFVVVAMTASLLACASNRGSTAQSNMPPQNDDLLTLLTGFGESISKKDFLYAVNHLTPNEREQILDARGQVPEEKQNQLQALELQRLIRLPSVRVVEGRLAGIVELLPNLRQGDGVTLSEEAGSEQTSSLDPLDPAADLEASQEVAAADVTQSELQETVGKFFSAVSAQNWKGALALINENERKLFVDAKGNISEDAKQRLAKIDRSNPQAFAMKDGTLVGVTLLLPAP